MGMGIIGTIVIGFLVGLVARFVKPGDDKMGMVATTVVGIVGAFLGNYLGHVLGLYQIDEPAGFVGAVIGDVIVLVLLKLASGRKALA